MNINVDSLEDLVRILTVGALGLVARIGFALFFVWLGYRLTLSFEDVAERIVKRSRPQDSEVFIRAVRRLVGITGISLSIALALMVLGVNIEALVTGLGLTSVALGFALKDIIEQAVTGVLILFQRPFKVGDVIEVDTIEGTVVDVAIRTTVVRTFDGVQVLIPNNRVYQSVIRNKTHYPTRRFDVPLGIAYSSNLPLAHKTLLDAVLSIPEVLREPAPTVSFENFDANAIRAVVRYWVEPDKVDALSVRTNVTRVLTDACEQVGIAIPAALVVPVPPATQ